MRTLVSWQSVVILALLTASVCAVPPKRLAIFYGWPIAVNGYGTVEKAAKVFNNYDIVVFGSGLEDPLHPAHDSTEDIISMTSAQVYGYADSTLDLEDIMVVFANWSAMGVHGIFLDQFGFDFGLTRTKQNDEVDAIHGLDLSAFVNAWNPDDVFLISGGINTHLMAGDIYLAESNYVLNGGWQDVAEWKAKSDKMLDYRAEWNVDMACVTTTITEVGYTVTLWNNGYFACAIYDFDACGWGEPYFSASDSLLPYRNRLPIYGDVFTDDLTDEDGVFEHQTNIGMKLDTVRKTVSIRVF